MAGALAAIVGYASTFTLVMAALTAAGASPQQAGSGPMSVCIAIGILNIVVSSRVKLPVSFAWSTDSVGSCPPKRAPVALHVTLVNLG